MLQQANRSDRQAAPPAHLGARTIADPRARRAIEIEIHARGKKEARSPETQASGVHCGLDGPGSAVREVSTGARGRASHKSGTANT